MKNLTVIIGVPRTALIQTKIVLGVQSIPCDNGELIAKTKNIILKLLDKIVPMNAHIK